MLSTLPEDEKHILVKKEVEITKELAEILDKMEHAVVPFVNDALYLYLGAVGAHRMSGLKLALINEDGGVVDILLGNEEEEDSAESIPRG